MDSLFVTNEGYGFEEGTIGRKLLFFVENCGVRLGSTMAFVDMRKVITTQMLKKQHQKRRQSYVECWPTADKHLVTGACDQIRQT